MKKLAKINLQFLKNFHIYLGETYSMCLQKNIIKFMSRTKNLSTIVLDVDFRSSSFPRELFKCLKNSSNTLQTMNYPSYHYYKKSCCEELFSNLTVLEEILISPEFLSDEVCINNLLKLLDNCKFSLKKIIFGYYRYCKKLFHNQHSFCSNNLKAIVQGILKLKNLKELSIGYPFSQIVPLLPDVIKTKAHTLTHLTIANFQNICDVEIYEAISNCSNLKKIEIAFIIANLRKIFTDLFYQHNSLENLILTGECDENVNEHEFILDVLSNLKYLKKIRLPNIHMPELCVTEFCRKANGFDLNFTSVTSFYVFTEEKNNRYEFQYNYEKEMFFFS